MLVIAFYILTSKYLFHPISPLFMNINSEILILSNKRLSFLTPQQVIIFGMQFSILSCLIMSPIKIQQKFLYLVEFCKYLQHILISYFWINTELKHSSWHLYYTKYEQLCYLLINYKFKSEITPYKYFHHLPL